MTVLRSVLVYAWIVLILLVMSPYRWYCEHVMKSDEEKGRRMVHRMAHWFTKWLLRIGGITLEVKGKENVPKAEPVVLVGNHQSMLDIAVMLAVMDRPVGFLAKAELGKIGVVRHWILAVGSVFIERGEARKGLEAILACIKKVKAGHAMMIYPEGTRTKDGSVGEFKAGSMKIALKSGACLVPVAIEGADRAMPRGKVWIYKQRICLTFLEPMAPEEIKGMDTQELADQVRDKVAQAVEKSR